MGFAVGLLELGTCVFGRLGHEEGFSDGSVNVAVQQLFVHGVLDRVGESVVPFVDREGDGDRDRDLKQNVHASMQWVNTAD